MTTFEFAAVRGFADDLNARLSRCDNGEGMECATLDDSFRHYATVCRELRENIRRWGRAVFAGRVAFDPEVERVWLTEAKALSNRAVLLLSDGRRAGDNCCWALDGRVALQAALYELNDLITDWVTPQRSVGPAARLGLPLDPAAAEEAQRRLDALPPLPSDWQPADPVQRARLGKLRGAAAS